MDSRFHSTVMHRPQEEEDDHLRRDRMNEASQNFRAQRAPSPPPQANFPPPYSPTKGLHSRPVFNSQYHPPTPAPLPLPSAAGQVAAQPSSPLAATAPGSYPTEFQSAPRDKPTNNYYDPTSDSSERRPAEGAAWYNGHAQTPQVSCHAFTTTTASHPICC